MKLTTTILFVFVELMVVINSSYSKTNPRTKIQDQNRRQNSILSQCPKPLLRNGSGRLQRRKTFIHYVCKQGFTLFGNQYSSCKNGEWDSSVPICIKPGCPILPAPENGNTYFVENGASTMLFCNPGYTIDGSEKSFCNGNRWDRSLGSCRETRTNPSMSCDFEVDSICGWEPDPTPDLEWERKDGYLSVGRTQTGPKHDHTVGVPLEGHFMLATFTGQSTNSVARILSPIYPAAASEAACFRFYSHMYGAITGALRIYVKPKSIPIPEMLESSEYLKMEKNGSDVNAWLESVFEIEALDQDFQIIIEAKETHTTRSNIAVDDVALLNGADCANEQLKSTTVTSEEGGIYDAQSCVNRCNETSSHSKYVTQSIITSSNKTVNILQCDCFDGCVDVKSCCLDYESVCVVDLSTVSTDTEVDTEVTDDLVRSTPASVRTIPTTKTVPTTKTIPTIKTVPTTKTISTIKTVPTTSKTISTTKNISTTIPYKQTTATVKLVTAPAESTPTERTTSPKTTTTTVLASKGTTFATIKKAGTVLPPKLTTSSVAITPTRKVDTAVPENGIKGELNGVNVLGGTHPLSTNLLNIFGFIFLAVTIIALPFVAFKFYQKLQDRRFNYKSKSKRNSDDASDEVRFLTADELLDFPTQADDWYDG